MSAVQYSSSDRIGVITLNRPEARNAVDREMALGLEAAIDRLEADPDVWVGVLGANTADQANPVFCAGADLKVVRETGSAAALDTDRGGFAGFVYRERQKPIVVEVDGLATAGGLEIVLAADVHGVENNFGELKASDISGYVYYDSNNDGLRAGETPVAAAIVLRHQDRAFYFKLGVDERFAKFSPGVQLTLDLTRRLCADPSIATVDSSASPDHAMINPIWRGRLSIGDVLIPLRRRDPVVSLIRTALTLRRAIRGSARRFVHLLRKSQEKSS